MTSLRKKIDLNCKNCTYDHSAAGTWRQQVKLCGISDCVFYQVRPGPRVLYQKVFATITKFQTPGTNRFRNH